MSQNFRFMSLYGAGHHPLAVHQRESWISDKPTDSDVPAQTSTQACMNTHAPTSAIRPMLNSDFKRNEQERRARIASSSLGFELAA